MQKRKTTAKTTKQINQPTSSREAFEKAVSETLATVETQYKSGRAALLNIINKLKTDLNKALSDKDKYSAMVKKFKDKSIAAGEAQWEHAKTMYDTAAEMVEGIKHRLQLSLEKHEQLEAAYKKLVTLGSNIKKAATRWNGKKPAKKVGKTQKVAKKPAKKPVKKVVKKAVKKVVKKAVKATSKKVKAITAKKKPVKKSK